MEPSKWPKVFISYSRKDDVWKQRLVTHLDALRDVKLEIWSDDNIEPGSEWPSAIKQALESAHAAVLLITPDFLCSGFIRDHEVPTLATRRATDGLPVVPIFVRPCLLEEFGWLNGQQGLPKDRAWLVDKPNGAEAELAKIAREIGRLAREHAARVNVAGQARAEIPLNAAPTRSAAIVELAELLGVTLEPVHFTTTSLDEEGQSRTCTLVAYGFVERADLPLIAVPGGMFLMGSLESEPGHVQDERPRHEVAVPSFFMGRFPVTVAQWATVSQLPRVGLELAAVPPRAASPHRPIEHVSWLEAAEFCARLEVLTGRPYRLPSEAEWEYAARAGTTTPFAFGRAITRELVRHASQSRAGDPSHAAGPRSTSADSIANPFGLVDMHGNVAEWTLDHWHADYVGAPTDGSAWLSPRDARAPRIIRGGSWRSPADACRSAHRARSRRTHKGAGIGFRVVCAPRAR